MLNNKIIIASLGGLLAGLSLLEMNFILMIFALVLLWEVSIAPRLSFVWGFIAVLVGYRWLLDLHPLDWMGIPNLASLFVSNSILLLCSAFGGILVFTWSRILTFIYQILNSRIDKDIYEYPSFIIFMSSLWGLSEVWLSHSPFFWIGVGGSLLPGDVWLAGLARVFGEGGLVVIQLLIGWWIWRLINLLDNLLLFRKLIFRGFLIILLAHIFGYCLLNFDMQGARVPVAVLQPAIPVRDKFSGDMQLKAKSLLKTSLARARDSGASFLIAPEGFILPNQNLTELNTIPLLSGGFRYVEDELRSSLLVFEKEELNFSSAIDKHRLVPLGEFLPEIPGLQFSGLSLVGGLNPGDSDRLLEWSGPPMAVAICYELSDGNAIAKSVNDGAKWILSIANLDPYTKSLHDQFLALAQLRSIETGRDLIISANTGPSSLILSNGSIASNLNSYEEGFGLFDLELKDIITPYVLWREIPLLILIALTSIRLNYISRTKISS